MKVNGDAGMFQKHRHSKEGFKMKKSYRAASALSVLVVSMLAASGAQAQTTPRNPDGPFAMAGSTAGYIGLNAGQTDYRLGNGNGFFNSDNRATAYKLVGGAYFTNNFGVEVGYTDFGRINRGGGETRADGFSLSVVGKLPIAPSINLLGRLGTTYGRTEVSAAAGSGLNPGSDLGFGLSGGVGAEFKFSPKLSAVLEYDSHDLRFAGSSRDRETIGMTSVGVRYQF